MIPVSPCPADEGAAILACCSFARCLHGQRRSIESRLFISLNHLFRENNPLLNDLRLLYLGAVSTSGFRNVLREENSLFHVFRLMSLLTRLSIVGVGRSLRENEPRLSVPGCAYHGPSPSLLRQRDSLNEKQALLFHGDFGHDFARPAVSRDHDLVRENNTSLFDGRV